MPTLEATGLYGVPGLKSVLETTEAQIWRGSYEMAKGYFVGGAWIDGAARDVGNTGATTVLRPGLLMGRRYGSATDGYQLTTWDPTAVDGAQDPFGILLWSTHMNSLGVDDDKFIGHVLVGGLVRAASIIIPGASSTPGLEGKADGVLVRELLSAGGRFQLDDGPHDWSGNGHNSWVTVTANLTLTLRDSGKMFILSGDNDITLPAVANSRGFRIDVIGKGTTPGNVVAASAGDLLPADTTAVTQNQRTTVYGMDGTDFLAVETA